MRWWVGGILLVVGLGLGWRWKGEWTKYISHEDVCNRMAVDYLGSVQKFQNINAENDMLAWANAIKTETKILNLCKSELNYPDLSKYEILKLADRKEWGSEIVMGEIESTDGVVIVQKFYFQSDGKRVSGLMHLPERCTKCPVIVQFRGYYDKEKYYSGAGTRKTAVEFARAGFVSLAPDFLGYGESDSRAANIFEARFETYTTAANFLGSVDSLPVVDGTKVGIWGHSNGGHIALTALEITGRSYPTVLWAPVTAGFPFSVLYYTYDYDDLGKALRKDLARMEEDVEADKFTLVNYLERITAPILLQQGTADPEVPVKWSRDLNAKMKESGKSIKYVEYGGADHNLVPKWNEAVRDDIEFYSKYW